MVPRSDFTNDDGGPHKEMQGWFWECLITSPSVILTPAYTSSRTTAMLSFKVLTLAAVLGVASVNAADTALCGAHGIMLRADNGLSPCEIASLMVGQGGEHLRNR